MQLAYSTEDNVEAYVPARRPPSSQYYRPVQMKQEHILTLVLGLSNKFIDHTIGAHKAT